MQLHWICVRNIKQNSKRTPSQKKGCGLKKKDDNNNNNNHHFNQNHNSNNNKKTEKPLFIGFIGLPQLVSKEKKKRKQEQNKQTKTKRAVQYSPDAMIFLIRTLWVWEDAFLPYSCHSVSIDRLNFRSDFSGMRFPWECYDQLQESNGFTGPNFSFSQERNKVY